MLVSFHTFHSRWPHVLLARFRYKARRKEKYGLAYALMKGVRRSGMKVRIAGREDACRGDIAVFWSWVRPQRIDAALAGGSHVVIMERGFLPPRRAWVSLAVDGFNGRGKFAPAADDGQRWNRYFAHQLKPWKQGGAYALLLGQIWKDRANPGFDAQAWAQDQADRLLSMGLQVRYRPHPWSYSSWHPRGTELSYASLEEDLAAADRAVIFNSNAAVEAVLAGVPVVACDAGCIAYDLASHDVAEPLIRPDRSRWCHDMAWRQWSVEELASGEAWRHTMKVLHAAS